MSSGWPDDTAEAPPRRTVPAPPAGPVGLPRLLSPAGLPGHAGLAEHLAAHGHRPAVPAEQGGRLAFVEEVDRAGLRGRGGAGFPTALKMAAVLAERGRPVVVANGTEGEPASAKDKVLLAKAPHLVLDGTELAAEAVGADEAVVVCHPAVLGLVQAALDERRRARLDGVGLRVVEAAEGFVAGEASAVVNWLRRGRPIPTRTPPRLSERGLYGRPTLVQNVETLAHLALVARFGADWYRSVGPPEEPGSLLVTLLGGVERPGVYEVAVGTTVSSVLEAGGGSAPTAQALLLGGYFGTWVDYGSASERPFSRAGLAPLGASPGAGLVAMLPADACGLAETARLARYLASQSAGQCGPCVFGLPAIASQLEALAAGEGFRRDLLVRWLAQVDGRGACAHPDGAVRLVRSALRVFREEVERHARGRCIAPPGRRVLPVPALGAVP